MKSRFYPLLAVLFTLILQNCQDNPIEKSLLPSELISRISVADEKKLLQGLDYMLAKTSSGARVNQSKINKLKLDSVIRRIDPKTGSTNYSFFIEENRPYSVANLVVTENKGAYLAFLVEYISSDPKKEWDLGNFQGKMRLTTIDGKNERIIQINPPKDKGGRTDGAICSTTVWRVTASSEWGSSTYYETETFCYFVDVFDGSYGELNDTGNNVTPGMTGINDNGTSSTPEFMVDGGSHGKDIPNVAEYLKCFTANGGAEVTIYIDQPEANSPQTYDLLTGHVGHSWVSITQNGITRLVGFYPNGVALPTSDDVNGKFKEDSDRSFDVSVSFDFNADQMADVLSFIRGPIPDYQVNDYNCTDFVIELFSKANISLPKTVGYWPRGQGFNPGNFGQDMRNYQGNQKSINPSGGSPVSINGTCN